MEIIDLSPNQFIAAAQDGRLTVGGEVASEAVRWLLIEGAGAAYGADNVTDEFTVSNTAYTTFWMYNMPHILGLLTPFPRYEIRVIDGFISGRLQGGVNFPVNSTEISSEIASLLNIAVAIMTRDLSLTMTVEGHTDSSGPDASNQALSLARAESVVAFFAAAGIDPTRLTALGAGEAKPIAPNTTPNGRALNRRVEFLLGPNRTESNNKPSNHRSRATAVPTPGPVVGVPRADRRAPMTPTLTCRAGRSGRPLPHRLHRAARLSSAA